MRISGLLVLIVALAVVALIAKQSLKGASTSVQSEDALPARGETVRMQSQQLQQQVRDAMEAAMQTPRDAPEDE